MSLRSNCEEQQWHAGKSSPMIWDIFLEDGKFSLKKNGLTNVLSLQWCGTAKDTRSNNSFTKAPKAKTKHSLLKNANWYMWWWGAKPKNICNFPSQLNILGFFVVFFKLGYLRMCSVSHDSVNVEVGKHEITARCTYPRQVRILMAARMQRCTSWEDICSLGLVYWDCISVVSSCCICLVMTPESIASAWNGYQFWTGFIVFHWLSFMLFSWITEDC